MSLKIRRFIFFILFIFFISISPILIRLAQGYKFDWQDKTWNQTGVLFLESKPTKAEVFLDGQIQESKTTTRIKSLKPGDYQVEVAKEGFKGWSKKMEIEENLTTFAQYIQLFKNELVSEDIFPKEISSFSEKVDTVFFVAYENEDAPEEKESLLIKIDTEDNEIKQVTSHDEKIESIFPSPTGKTLIFQDEMGDWFFVNEDLQNKVSLAEFVPEKSVKISFDDRNKDVFYFLDQKGIYSVDMALRIKKMILIGDIVDFVAQKNKIIYIENQGKTSLLAEIDARRPNGATELSSLPVSQDYVFFESPDGIVSFVDSTNDIFYLFDFDLKVFDDKKMIIPDVKEIVWHDNGRSFVFSNKNEIWVYRQEEDKYSKKLITRLSTPINKTLWFGVDTHVIYFTDDKMYIKETISEDPFLVEYENVENIDQAFIWKNKITTVSENGVETFLIQ